ncbi:hydantoinase/oxoprolinase family protein [Rhizobiaceae bacterium BDR2-2]|uniref:Hydantoinase/oxoprolinase family protein n=1 Tax=Ectorhizobium quercum TaxID=2965071 RepID=A0AAE3MXX5_9HYPH|nr:hydantoinase/oxoprolinase family protein [Ectorhizobium quercum]MCX8996994.1 hydantoinase/oxoprolinase family protein [Ectorhizobium quercum]
MSARIRVASDVGGTFTDSIAYDEATGAITVSKVSTTPDNRARGTVQGLKRAIALQGATGRDVTYVGHGTTTTTNAVIQRKGATTAFITNRGFRDLLLIGRQNRPTLFDIAIVRPEPLVPQELCLTVRGRLGPGGEEIEPLNEDDVREAAAFLAGHGVEAVAILFLHSYANPSHEQRARDLLETLLPDAAVCISTDINSEFREYERASTAVLNAYLRPVMHKYLASLGEMLADDGEGLGLRPGRPVMVMDAAGGLMSIDSARVKPVHTVLSGPAGGVVASAHVAEMAGISDIITMDIGGTSTDISLIRKGRPEITRSTTLETVPIRLPVIDINAIGAGGGSIAWIDDGGALRVGPMSAEAVPGPVCYGRGGTRPTVTDANLVLGRFDDRSRLGGDLGLDAEAARAAIEREIATPLGLDLYEAAAGILRVAHANIVRGIRVVSVERGYDPREFALVPFGGAGPMHGSPVARELRMPRVMVPPTPGILCAMGQLISDLHHTFAETHIAAYREDGAEEALAAIRTLVERAQNHLAADGVAMERREIEVKIDVRYIGQSYDLPIPVDIDAAGFWRGLPARFHAAHEARFGHADPSSPLEIVGIVVTGIGRIDKPVLPALPKGDIVPLDEALKGSRRIHFEPFDPSAPVLAYDAPIYDRAGLRAGDVIRGPAVIEEISATTIVYPGDVLTVHASGNLIVEVAQ